MSSSNNSLSDKTVLITGASSGIGAQTAVHLATHLPPSSLFLHYRSDKAGAESVKARCLKINSTIKIETFHADLSEQSQVEGLYNQIIKSHSKIDVLFANAGNDGGFNLGPGGNIEDVSPEVFRKSWEINTLAPYILTRLVLPPMAQRGYGRIVYNSSVAALVGGVVGPHYASSKSALHGMMRWCSNEYCSKGITINAIAPALIEGTNFFKTDTQEKRDAFQKKIPIGRLGKVEEAAEVVAMMMNNSYIHNKVWCLDGGLIPQ